MNRDDRNCWFHGKITRNNAEELLKNGDYEDGTFLVRESNTAVGDYVLSLLYQNLVVHYQIRRHGEDAFFSIDDKVKILHGLDTLVEFYKQAANGLVTKLMTYVKNMPPPNDARSHGMTNLLHRATISKSHAVISALLKTGYRNIEEKNPDGQTAMHLVALHCDEDILRLLLNANVSVTSMDSAGNTPLHYACRSKSGSFIRTLIEGRAKVQARNMKNGYVPLHDAAKSGNLEAVQELLAAHAPYLPRTNSGEFPIDLAKEQNHEHVTAFLSNFKLPPASTHLNKWYHGTLKREEATEVLLKYARDLKEQQQVDVIAKNLETTDTLDNNDMQQKFDTSGCFLVRFSERKNGSSGYVLTLLWEGNVKNFIISKSTNYLFIDDGPYHPSLEHLVEHFMRFSDGLPVNLKYAVPPKPKPPLPSFKTFPRHPKLNNSTNKLLATHTLNPKSRFSDVISNTLNRHRKKENPENKIINKPCKDVLELNQAQSVLQNLTFSTEFSSLQFDNSTQDSIYNVPKNNAKIVEGDISEIMTQSDADMKMLEEKTDAEVEYFTKSDLAIEYVSDREKSTPSKITSHNDDGLINLDAKCQINAIELSNCLNKSPLLNNEIKTSSIISYDDINDPEAIKMMQAQKYIIPPAFLELKVEIGGGEFGTVYKGILRKHADDNGVQEVAIKTLQDEKCVYNKEAFLRESAAMMQLHHHCIVQLIGISRGNTFMMVQELMPLGSMLDFILFNRHETNLFNDLKLWSAQIACGMQYLEARHYVHRDLAARNILLASRLQAKISDFGLSRALSKDDNFYQASTGGRWPIKWCAPESFKNGIFSHASDVWAFGITLWEMFSLGEIPYGDMLGEKAILLIEKGYRLPKTQLCPDHVYEIMRNCWHYKAKDRPTFHFLMDFFSKDPVYQNLIELIRTEHIG